MGVNSLPKTVMGHAIVCWDYNKVSWPRSGSSSSNYEDPYVVRLSLVCLCFIKVWESLRAFSSVIISYSPYRGCDRIPGDTGISSGQQDSVAAAIWVQHANHSATERPQTQLHCPQNYTLLFFKPEMLETLEEISKTLKKRWKRGNFFKNVTKTFITSV